MTPTASPAPGRRRRKPLSARLLAGAVSIAVSLAVIGGIGFATVAGVGFLEDRADASPAPEPMPPLEVPVVTWVRQDSYAETVSYLGRVEARRSTELSFEEQGRLAAIHVEEGDLVKAGDTIARLDAALLVAQRDAAVASRQQAEAELELARITELREKRLLDQGHISASRYDDARFAARSLEARVKALTAEIDALEIRIARTSVVAPFDAVVTARRADEGGVMSPGVPVVTLREAGAPQARVSVAPDIAGRFVPGETYPVKTGGAMVEARLRAAIPDLDPATRSVDLIFDLPAGLAAIDGATVELDAALETPGAGGWLPVAALREGAKGLWTVLVAEEGRVVTESVQIVALSGDRAYVAGTLADGAQVIAAGVNRVSPGQPVKPVAADAATLAEAK